MSFLFPFFFSLKVFRSRFVYPSPFFLFLGFSLSHPCPFLHCIESVVAYTTTAGAKAADGENWEVGLVWVGKGDRGILVYLKREMAQLWGGL